MKIVQTQPTPGTIPLWSLEKGTCFKLPAGECVYILCTRRYLTVIRKTIPLGREDEKVVVNLSNGAIYLKPKNTEVIPLTVTAHVEAP